VPDHTPLRLSCGHRSAKSRMRERCALGRRDFGLRSGASVAGAVLFWLIAIEGWDQAPPIFGVPPLDGSGNTEAWGLD
jgi:hypothetical protein